MNSTPFNSAFGLSGFAPKTRPTLADVAAAAGVHPTTVSLALRNSPKLPAETRRRLCSMAEKLGYRPDVRMQALVAFRNRRLEPSERPKIAVFRSEETIVRFPRWRESLRGAETVARVQGYELEVFTLGAGGLSVERALGILEARSVTGVLLMPGAVKEHDWAHAFWSELCVVGMSEISELSPWHQVCLDVGGMLKLAAVTLRGRGVKRVAVVSSHPALVFPPEVSVVTDLGSIDRDWLARVSPQVLVGDAGHLHRHLDGLNLRSRPEVVGVGLEPSQTGRGVFGGEEQLGEVAAGILANMLRLNQTGFPEAALETRVRGRWRETSQTLTPAVSPAYSFA